MNGFVEEPKRAMENGVKAAHETAHSAAAHAKKAHLPADSKIAQMSQKPMAHVEAKGVLPWGQASSRPAAAARAAHPAYVRPGCSSARAARQCSVRAVQHSSVWLVTLV